MSSRPADAPVPADLAAGEQWARAWCSGLDPDCWAGTDAAAGAERLAVVIRRLEAAQLRLAHRAQQCTAHQGSDRTAPGWFARLNGSTVADARRALDVAGRLDACPAAAQALIDGELSVEKTAAVTEAAATDPTAEQRMVDTARRSDLFETRAEADKIKQASRSAEDEAARHARLRRGRSWKVGPGRDGHTEVRAQFVPADYAQIKPVLDAYMKARLADAHDRGERDPYDAYAADAALNAIAAAGHALVLAPPPTSAAGASEGPGATDTTGPTGISPSGATPPTDPAGAGTTGTTATGAAATATTGMSGATATGAAANDTTGMSGATATGAAANDTTGMSGATATGAAATDPAGAGTTGATATAGLGTTTTGAAATATPGMSGATATRGSTGSTGSTDTVGSTATSAASGRLFDTVGIEPVDGLDPKVDWNVVILVDGIALKRGYAAPGETCEIPGVGPIPVAWIHQLLPTAQAEMLIHDSVDIRAYATSTRHRTRPVDLGVRVRDRDCNAGPCHLPISEIDHRVPFADTHDTSMINLGGFCNHDHDNKSYRGGHLERHDTDWHWWPPGTDPNIDPPQTKPIGRHLTAWNLDHLPGSQPPPPGPEGADRDQGTLGFDAR